MQVLGQIVDKLASRVPGRAVAHGTGAKGKFCFGSWLHDT